MIFVTREIDHGNYKNSTDHIIRVLEIAEKTRNKKLSGRAYNSLAEAYAYQDLYVQAKEYFTRAARIFEEINDQRSLAVVYMNLANIEYALGGKTGNLKPALTLYLKSAAIHRNRENVPQLISVLGNLSNTYIDMNEFEKAFFTLDTMQQLAEKSNNVAELTNVYYFRARAFSELGKFDESIKHFEAALELANKQGNQDMILEIYKYMSHTYDNAGNYKDALLYIKKSNALKDSIFQVENSRHLNEMATRFETAKKDLQLKNQNERIARQNIIVISSIALGVLLLLLLLLFFSRARIRQKANDKLAKAYNLIEAKNKDITDSINYAKKIQSAILPDDQLVTKIFPESFIFFKPRDIVSGDFYWVAEKDNRRFFAVADCTGHGVPGSMMSMIGNALLNQFVLEKNISDPAEILNSMRSEIIRSLRQSAESNKAKDGMDISLCVFDDDNKKKYLHFAGAHNSLYLVRNGELRIIKADRFPVAISAGEIQPFTLQKIELLAGDMLFMTTDGFSDQFGGPAGKKFKFKQLKETLISIHSLPLNEQQLKLSGVFLEWQGDHEQVDDVCIAGIRI